jgi:hypothetical protein
MITVMPQDNLATAAFIEERREGVQRVSAAEQRPVFVVATAASHV